MDGSRRVEYLAFLLAGDAYAVPIVRVAEILKPLPIAEVPRAPPNVLGVMSVRGRLVTVLDLRRRLGRAESPVGPKTRILLTDIDNEQVGLLVDEVLHVYRLSDTDIEPASVLGGEQAGHIAGIGHSAGALLILLDLHPILSA